MPEMKKGQDTQRVDRGSEQGQRALSGAIVQVIGTTQGTVTDTDGHAEIAVPGGSKLMISYPGYEPATVDTKQHSQKEATVVVLLRTENRAASSSNQGAATTENRSP